MAENIPARTRRNRNAQPPPPLEAVEAPDPPSHLSEEAAALWRDIVDEWVLGPEALPLLRGALEQWDNYQRCRAQVAQDGPTFTTESGMTRAHPAAKLALDSFAAFRMALRQLGLDPPK